MTNPESAPLSEIETYRAALKWIVNLLGPDDVCNCSDTCRGLQIEAREALHCARSALGMPMPPVAPFWADVPVPRPRGD